ncbi:MAG: hypothetical protein HYV03_01225 [Deltaproteobacteria bacterium]|nr:hypothetical protein [Deltaproteobacteria bacterium]
MQLEKICLPVQAQLAAAETVIREGTTSTVPIITQVVQYIIQNGGKRVSVLRLPCFRPGSAVTQARLLPG